jgi:electron transfer flavoprotein beta subunit
MPGRNTLPVKMVVTVKLVPDTNADKRIDPASKRLVRAGVETVLNPFDEYAIEAALQIRDARADGSTVTVFSMAPEAGKEVVRKALAMGADDAVMLSDPALEGADVAVTAHAMSRALGAVGFDLIVMGTQSTDATTGALPGMLAEFLGVPGVTYVRKLACDGASVQAERETERGYQRVSAALPALVSVTKSINVPRYPSLKGIMGAKKKEIRMLRVADLPPNGALEVRTEVMALSAPPQRAKGRVVTATDPGEGARAVVEFLRERKLL